MDNIVYLLFTLIVAYSNASEQSETEDIIRKVVEDVAKRDFNPSLQIEEVPIKLKGVSVTDWTTLKMSGPSTWIKDYKGGDEGNYDHMNLTLSLETLKVDIQNVFVGPFSGKVWVEIGENEAELKMTSKGYVNPGKCEIQIHEVKLKKLNKVIVHSNIPEIEGLDISEIMQTRGIPLANRLAKTIKFEKLVQHLVGKHCKISAGKAVA